MCTYLDPASFMVYVFANSPQNQAARILHKLRKLRDEVANSLEDQNVFIEWTRNAVLGAVECFPDIFKQEDTKIIWQGSNDGLEKQGFNDGFSQDFEERLNDAIKKALELEAAQ